MSTTLDTNQITIDGLSSLGGSLFFRSQALFCEVLDEIESANTGKTDLQSIKTNLSNAINDIEIAKSYFMIKNLSNSSVYNTFTLKKLMEFDYEKYRISRKLNKEIFDRVVYFLKNSKISEAFIYQIKNFDDLVFELKFSLQSINNTNQIEPQRFWKINQLYFETALFGQYIAEILFNI